MTRLRVVVLVFFALFLIHVGCSRKMQTRESTQRILTKLEVLEPTARGGTSKADKEALNRRCADEARRLVQGLDDPRNLGDLFGESQNRAEAFGASQEAGCVNPYVFVCEAALYRLGELSSPEAAAVLIDLYKNERLRESAATMEGLIESLKRCGKPALAQLMELHRSDPADPAIRQVIEEIKRDQGEDRTK